ncbi:MAG: RNA-guided pseudouridylation complex pseudouridine synthase subunit Cbf5 [Nanoarchaeota archaeon]|nr:RNA-guided pseudouridylation complex pseudouridine synthase subunit Cbf5 [Nanoarchaeota archaeon]
MAIKISLDKIRKERPIKDLLKFGIINIDKPSGPTSFQVSQFIKDALRSNKTSHFGTLDPTVSGVLPIGLGRACRLNDYFMHRDKTYVGVIRLHKEVPDSEFKRVMEKFLGKIKQTPPVRSSVKRAERIREIKVFKILERNGKDLLFETEVEAGTYIRKLCDDMGKEIGGAHMLELRRTKAGMFMEKQSINLYDFEKAVQSYKNGQEDELRAMIIPAEVVCEVIPVIQIRSEVVTRILSGSPIFSSFLKNIKDIHKLKEGEKICIFSEEKFIGCYEFIGGEDIVARPEFVFN